jgi:lipopolysaccharide/colanic/teichoic acid biosynthesis glycosyltransferase
MNAYADAMKVETQPALIDSFPADHVDQVELPNKQRRRLGLYVVLAALDGAAVVLALALASLALFRDPVGWQSARLTGVILPLFVAFALSQRAYSVEALADPAKGALRSILSLLLAAAIAVMMLHQVGVLHVFNIWLVAYALGLALPLLMLSRTGMRFVSDWALQRQPVSELVIADGVPVKGAAHQLVVNAHGAGLSADLSDPLMLDRVGTLLKNVDRVTIACPPEREESWTLILKGAGVSGEVRAASPALPFSTEPVDIFGHRYAIFRQPSLHEVALKRLMDLVVVVPMLFLFAPLLAAIAIAIRIDSPGAILFVQERIGRGNRIFRMYKFRSMRAERSDACGNVSASRDDNRITRVGRWLRATSMDELPQLFNVLLGSMSLVGPRPHALGSTASEKLFWDIDRRYWLRHACAPGLTGLAQVRGYRGATHHSRDLENRLAADLEYMRDWSLWLDVVILFRTFGVVVHRNAF